jgi:hypothetical protein
MLAILVAAMFCLMAGALIILALSFAYAVYLDAIKGK